MSEHQTPEQRASNVCRRLADAPIVDPSDYLASQAIIAAAIREAEAEAIEGWRVWVERYFPNAMYRCDTDGEIREYIISQLHRVPTTERDKLRAALRQARATLREVAEDDDPRDGCSHAEAAKATLAKIAEVLPDAD